MHNALAFALSLAVHVRARPSDVLCGILVLAMTLFIHPSIPDLPGYLLTLCDEALCDEGDEASCDEGGGRGRRCCSDEDGHEEGLLTLPSISVLSFLSPMELLSASVPVIRGSQLCRTCKVWAKTFERQPWMKAPLLMRARGRRTGA